jgi:CO/xanthine dehydrogenase FAD-binding subunit
LVTAVLVPDQSTWRSAFGKLGARRYLVISIAMVAVAIELNQTGTIQSARIAVGSCSPVARRLPQLEAALVGLDPLGDHLGTRIAEADLSPLSPLDDVRASASYRLDAARELIRRAVIAAATAV